MSTSNHCFVPPSQGDSRSPCPALNALANHSFLPHDGRRITAFQLMSVLREHYHISLPLAALLSLGGIFTCGRYFRIDLEDLALHNKIEHDASLTHANAFPNGKYAPVTVDKELLERLLDTSKDRNYMTFDDLVQVRAARNATLDRPLSKVHDIISRGEIALTTQLFADSEGRMPKQFIGEWFGEERLPQGWYKPATMIGLISTTRLANLVGKLIGKVLSSKKVD
ncbi:Cloroperoxidase [Lactifluus subvellereus]|nr:Cloroperoxidase [Lactifluus subvellereus]